MKAIVVWCVAGFVLCAAVMADTFRAGGPDLPFPIMMVAFLGAWAPTMFVMWTINGGAFGRVTWARFWPYISSLPMVLKAALGVLFVATLINFFVGMASTSAGPAEGDGPGLGFERMFVGNLGWLYAAVGALAYGVILQRRQASK